MNLVLVSASTKMLQTSLNLTLLLFITLNVAAATVFLFICYMGAISFCLWKAVLRTKHCLNKKAKAVQKDLSKLLP